MEWEKVFANYISNKGANIHDTEKISKTQSQK